MLFRLPVTADAGSECYIGWRELCKLNCRKCEDESALRRKFTRVKFAGDLNRTGSLA